jgi:hypothetical protein
MCNRGRVHEQGAVFVEFALVIPLLMVFALGIVEYGLAWKAANDVNAAARDAARSATSSTAYITSDQTALTQVGTGLTPTELQGIEKVIVYKATPVDTKPPSNCLQFQPQPNATVGSFGSCNVYSKQQLEWVLAHQTSTANFATDAGCGSSGNRTWDYNWCPTGRNHSQRAGTLDYLGVYIKMKHNQVTNFGFGDRMIERTAVFRLEPKYGGE